MAILMLAAGTAACAGPIKTRVAASGAMPPRGASFAILAPPAVETVDPIVADTTALVKTRLARLGYVESAKPAWLVQVAVSARPASSGVTFGDAAVMPVKRGRLLQDCPDQDYRLSVVFLDPATGAPARSAQATEYHCAATLAEALPHMVDAALSHGASRSRYRLSRD